MSKQRTITQNRAMHKYFDLMAKGLDGAGYDQIKFYDEVKKGFSVRWTAEAFKDFFRAVAHDLYPEVQSTADLTTIQLQRVYEVVDRGVSEKTGVRVDFPSYEPPLLEEHGIAA